MTPTEFYLVALGLAGVCLKLFWMTGPKGDTR